jgi:hypothetical protein
MNTMFTCARSRRVRRGRQGAGGSSRRHTASLGLARGAEARARPAGSEQRTPSSVDTRCGSSRLGSSGFCGDATRQARKAWHAGDATAPGSRTRAATPHAPCWHPSQRRGRRRTSRSRRTPAHARAVAASAPPLALLRQPSCEEERCWDVRRARRARADNDHRLRVLCTRLQADCASVLQMAGSQ